jgi:hypothetical protein
VRPIGELGEDFAHAGAALHAHTLVTGTDIIVDGGWSSAAAYLGNERSHYLLGLLEKKEQLQEFLQRFR